MGGWYSVGEIPLRRIWMKANVPVDSERPVRHNVLLWIENAHQSLAGAGLAPKGVCGDVVRTFQTKEQFFAILVSNPQGGAEETAKATRIALLAIE